jgi:hypothetical protein
MKKQNAVFLLAVVFSALIVAGLGACKKVETVIPPVKSVFLTPTASGTFSVLFPGAVYKIPLGITAVSNEDRTINVSVATTTGAVAGTHYSLSSSSIVIPAGEVVDTLVVTGVYNQYLSGRTDILVFTMSGVESAASNSTFTLTIKGPCFEGNVVANDMLGNYPNTTETGFGTYVYATSVSEVVPLTATTARIKVTNVFDSGWDPLEFILNWTDPANRTVTPVSNTTGIGGSDAGVLNSAYAGIPMIVRPHANGSLGTFSWCNNNITLVMQVGVAGLGWFGAVLTLQMER